MRRVSSLRFLPLFQATRVVIFLSIVSTVDKDISDLVSSFALEFSSPFENASVDFEMDCVADVNVEPGSGADGTGVDTAEA